MKKTSIVSLICVLALCCALLSGCMAEVMEVSILPDGSGTAKIQVGFTEEAIESLKQAQQMTEEEVAEMVPFTYNGVEYHGNVEDHNFQTIEELNSVLRGGEAESQAESVIKVVQNEDGSFNLRVLAGQIEADAETMKQDYMNEMGLSEEEATELVQSMVVLYRFTLPDKVVQVSGLTEGITIEDCVLTIDALAMSTEAAGAPDYEFSTSKEPKRVLAVYFQDVMTEDWFAPAVYTMARGGIVQGIGDHLFDPEGTLTYAEFCQIVARATMLETGEENGYWAAKAIQNCVDAGFIPDRGTVCEENYDVAIPREAAIAAIAEMNGGMPLAKANGAIVEADIPDYESISAEYQEKILEAYRVGITQGIDESRTFDPLATLTRAEICQLFYNIIA